SRAFQRRDTRARGTSPERGCPQPQHVRNGLDAGTLGHPWLVGAAAAGDSRAPAPVVRTPLRVAVHPPNPRGCIKLGARVGPAIPCTRLARFWPPSGFDVRQFPKRVKYLQSRPSEISVIARHNRQIVAAGSRGDIAVLSLLGLSRLRGGRSSIGTGHCFQTASQFGFCLSRRRITTSSSASKLASNWSPGAAGASAAGMLTRRLASSVTIMVGLSHKNPKLSIGWAESRNPFSIPQTEQTPCSPLDAKWCLPPLEPTSANQTK